MTTQTMTERVAEIAKAAPDTVTRSTLDLAIGEAIHQGDVYVHMVKDSHPRGAPLGTKQVAVGTTVGSRHIAAGAGVEVFAGKKLPMGVKTPEWCEESALLGPVVVASEPWTLAHPEHAHHDLPAGTFQVTYQADYTTRQRVQD